LIRLSFKKRGLNYSAGQYVFITVPELSYLESHPFSISSSPYEDTVMIHIRVLGDWTKRLYELSNDKNSVDIWIHGPYGALSVDINNSDKY
jgi:predicted ferric reductase